MRHASVFLVLFVAIAACGKKGESMDPLVKETMAKLTEARDKGCACKDVPCVTAVQNELGKWMLANSARLQELDKKSTPKQNEAGNKLSAELRECQKKLEAAEVAPPAAPQ